MKKEPRERKYFTVSSSTITRIWFNLGFFRLFFLMISSFPPTFSFFLPLITSRLFFYLIFQRTLFDISFSHYIYIHDLLLKRHWSPSRASYFRTFTKDERMYHTLLLTVMILQWEGTILTSWPPFWNLKSCTLLSLPYHSIILTWISAVYRLAKRVITKHCFTHGVM